MDEFSYVAHFEISVGLFLESNGAAYHLATERDDHGVGQKVWELFLMFFFCARTQEVLYKAQSTSFVLGKDAGCDVLVSRVSCTMV